MQAGERLDLERLRVLVASRMGLDYAEDKLDLLAEVAVKRAAQHSLENLAVYVERFDSQTFACAEIPALAEALTVTETFFFRNEEHFQVLTQVVVPLARRRDRRLRIVSAGCASGEEAYSMAIVLREALPDADAWDIRITGVDLNPAMLAKAERGSYSTWSLRATSEDIKRRYFVPQGRDFQLVASVRKMVNFESRNLVDEAPGFWANPACDAIFCRNVLMYFKTEVAQRIIARFERSLVPGGYLFLGYAETLRGLSQDYHLCHSHEAFYYQRRPFDTTRAEALPLRDALPITALPALVDEAGSWVDAIRQASQRVARLTERRKVPDAEPPTHAPVTDLAEVLALIHEERFGEALSLLRGLPSASQRDTHVMLLVAVVLTNKGARDEAESVCRQLLQIDELNAGAHYLLALCREHAADSSGAVECDRTAIYLDPNFAMPHLHLGLMAKRKRDLALARRELERALTLLARDDEARLLLFGGGFSRDALAKLCQSELASVGGRP